MRYYIADPHFYHNSLNYKMDKRGFESVEAMNEYMLRRWNHKVRMNDEVVILGDLSAGSAEETNRLLDRLNGRLYLILGNHDQFLVDKHYNSARFEWIKPYEELNDDKRKVVLCHYPIMCYNGQYLLDKDGNPRTYMLYGHVHDTHDQRLVEMFREITIRYPSKNPDGEEQKIPSNMINCFCMYSDYEPLTLDEWIICNRCRGK